MLIVGMLIQSGVLLYKHPHYKHETLLPEGTLIARFYCTGHTLLVLLQLIGKH
jgi:hypothetical protein